MGLEGMAKGAATVQLHTCSHAYRRFYCNTLWLLSVYAIIAYVCGIQLQSACQSSVKVEFWQLQTCRCCLSVVLQVVCRRSMDAGQVGVSKQTFQ